MQHWHSARAREHNASRALWSLCLVRSGRFCGGPRRCSLPGGRAWRWGRTRSAGQGRRHVQLQRCEEGRSTHGRSVRSKPSQLNLRCAPKCPIEGGAFCTALHRPYRVGGGEAKSCGGEENRTPGRPWASLPRGEHDDVCAAGRWFASSWTAPGRR